jgi:hypothetical protein
VRKGYVSAPEVQVQKQEVDLGSMLDVRETVSPDKHIIPIDFYDPYHKPHLENFFDSIRGTAELNCPPEIGYETAVTVLKVNEAIEKGNRLEFSADEFEI